jgi:hypothetical protein
MLALVDSGFLYGLTRTDGVWRLRRLQDLVRSICTSAAVEIETVPPCLLQPGERGGWDLGRRHLRVGMQFVVLAF